MPASSAPSPSARWLADASLLTTAVIWGLNILVVKQASQQLDPFVFNAIRMVLSTLVLGVCVAILHRRATLQRAASDEPSGVTTPIPWGRFIVFGLLSGLVYPILFMSGISRTTAGNTALLLSSMPMWTAILSIFLLSERLPLQTWLGLFTSLVGTAIIALAGGKVEFSSVHRQGDLLMLLAAICWAFATVLSGPLLRRVNPLRVSFWTSFAATPVHLILVAPSLRQACVTLQQRPMVAALLYSGVLSTGLAYVTWHYGVHRLGPSHAAIYQNVVTGIAVLGGWLMLHEQPQWIQVVGGLLIFAGLMLMRWRRTDAN